MVVGQAIAHGRSRALRGINLTVYMLNAPALALYDALGFAPYGVEPEALCLRGRYFDGQHMALALDATAVDA